MALRFVASYCFTATGHCLSSLHPSWTGCILFSPVSPAFSRRFISLYTAMAWSRSCGPSAFVALFNIYSLTVHVRGQFPRCASLQHAVTDVGDHRDDRSLASYRNGASDSSVISSATVVVAIKGCWTANSRGNTCHTTINSCLVSMVRIDTEKVTMRSSVNTVSRCRTCFWPFESYGRRICAIACVRLSIFSISHVLHWQLLVYVVLYHTETNHRV